MSPSQAQEKNCRPSPLLATVIDQQGMPVSGLQSTDFRVKVDGKEVSVSSIVEDSRKRRAVILLDTNAGMRDDATGKWTLAKEIATHIAQVGPWEDVSRVGVFGDAAQKGERATSLETIANLKNYDFGMISSGVALAGAKQHASPLFDSLFESVSLFQPPIAGDVVFLVTDGGDEGSKKKAKEVQEALLAHGVRVFAITLPMRYDAQLVVTGPGGGTDALTQRENTDFINLVVNSGGAFLRIQPNRRTNEWGFKFTDEERMRLATSLQILYLQAAKAYRIEWASLPGTVSSAQRRLDISVTSANKRLTVRHAKFLPPCGPAS